jgi:hypothetical protein
MFLRKYKGFIVITFISIFCIKMVISGAPVFFKGIDKQIMNNVIMQIEVEHSSEGDTAKKVMKFGDNKIIDCYSPISHSTVLNHFGINNSFIEHHKRYVNPYHPSVPTPPPNS